MKQPMVVGYKGEIGSFILNGLLKIMPKALDILCVDINESENEIVERVDASDVIFLCVPLQSTLEWMTKHKESLKDKVIVEQCSLKEWVYDNDVVRGLDIRSMHILFRPSQTPNLEDRRVGLFDGQFDKEMIDNIELMTQSKIVFYKSAEEHDREMAVQQALLHRTLLIMGKLLRECNGSTYISKKVLELEERVRKGNKDLYKMIQENKYLPEKLGQVRKSFEGFDINEYME